MGNLTVRRGLLVAGITTVLLAVLVGPAVEWFFGPLAGPFGGGMRDIPSLLAPLTVSLLVCAVCLPLTPVLIVRGMGGVRVGVGWFYGIAMVVSMALGLLLAGVAVSLWGPLRVELHVVAAVAAGSCLATAVMAVRMGRVLRDLPSREELRRYASEDQRTEH